MSIRLLSIGDIAPLETTIGYEQETQEVLNYLHSANFVIANLELPLTHNTTKMDKAITLRARPEVAPAIYNSGIDLVTIANNHALDFGVIGLQETEETLHRSGISFVGSGKTLEDAMQPFRISIGDVRIAVLGLACTLPPGFAASNDRPGIAPIRVRSHFYIDSMTLDEQPGVSPWIETEAIEEDVQRASNAIRTAKAQSDIVIIQIHWGVPQGWSASFHGPLALYQRPLAHALIDAGADVIVGHHAHVIHPIEYYNNGLIAYSIGNFLFHSFSGGGRVALTNSYPPYDLTNLHRGEALEAIILELNIAQDKKITTRCRPIILNNRGEPIFLHNHHAISVLDRLIEMSQPFGTTFEREQESIIIFPT